MKKPDIHLYEWMGMIGAISGIVLLVLLFAGVGDSKPAKPVPMFAVTHVDVSTGGFPNLVACVTYTRASGVAVDCNWGTR